jgi:hypothetical protein
MVGLNGTGHGDLFKQDKDWYYVLHTHNTNSRVSPRKTAWVKLIFDKGTWKIDPKSFTFFKEQI